MMLFFLSELYLARFSLKEMQEHIREAVGCRRIARSHEMESAFEKDIVKVEKALKETFQRIICRIWESDILVLRR